MKTVAGEVGPGGRRPSGAEYAAGMRRVRKEIVDLHGEMVLLLNYSAVNYTGTVSILFPLSVAQSRACFSLFCVWRVCVGFGSCRIRLRNKR